MLVGHRILIPRITPRIDGPRGTGRWPVDVPQGRSRDVTDRSDVPAPESSHS